MVTVDHVADLDAQREHLVRQLRAWSAYFRRVDGHGARSIPADTIAGELEAAGLGDVRRTGTRLQSIIDAWLTDALTQEELHP